MTPNAYGPLADKTRRIVNGEDLRLLTIEEAFQIEDIAFEVNDIDVLWALTPFTDNCVTDAELADYLAGVQS